MHSVCRLETTASKVSRGDDDAGGTAFEFSIGGQGEIMRLTPCKIGPLWATCRSADDATQLPRKRALLRAITCTYSAHTRIHMHTRVYRVCIRVQSELLRPPDSQSAPRIFSGNLATSKFTFTARTGRSWFGISVWPTIKGIASLCYIISKDLFERTSVDRPAIYRPSTLFLHARTRGSNAILGSVDWTVANWVV